MHVWLALSSLALTVLGSVVLARLLHHLHSWKSRRLVQGMILLIPLGSLGLGLSGLHHFSGQPCFLNAPGWDATLEVALPLTMSLLVVGAVTYGVTRLVFMIALVK